jgi:A/G-specific adenine glycosylase
MPTTSSAAVSPGDEFVNAIQSRILRWGRHHYREFAWRRPGIPAWQALVAEFLLLRTRATQAEAAFRRIRRQYPNARALAAASDEELIQLIRPLGLRWREPLFVELARELGRRNGRVPRGADELRELPGVGEYVAAATLALHMNRRAVIIDSNVVRLLCRLVGVQFDGETRRKRWLRDLAARLTPEQDFREFGYAILDLSMTVCAPGTPRCEACPLRDLCATGIE